MVLRQKIIDKKGVTILELLIAITISTLVLGLSYKIFTAGWNSGKEVLTRYHFRKHTGITFDAMLKNLTIGSGLVSLEEYEFTLINRAGITNTYRFDEFDSVVFLNDRPLINGVYNFQVKAVGPVTRMDEWGFSEGFAGKIDSLDVNGDGWIEFDEMDLNFDNSLKGKECHFIGLVEVELAVFFNSRSYFWKGIAHPRGKAETFSELEETSFF